MYRVAVVGAGPSGLYAAAALLTSDEPVSVEVLDRLPAPYGLVRYGVAPDHVKMKSVIRVLQRPFDPAELEFLADVPEPVLDALWESAVRDIHVIVRRGPQHVKFTPAELNQIGDLANADVIVHDDGLLAAGVPEPEERRMRQCIGSLTKWTENAPTGRPRRIHLHFLRTPVRILGTDGRVSGIEIERNVVDGDRVRGTGETTTLDVGLVVRAIGYDAQPIPGLPFDAATGTVPNEGGRVVRDGKPVPGAYVTGWIKRGPTGVIGTNKGDGIETAKAVLADLPTLPAPAHPEPEALRAALAEHGVRAVDWTAWLRLDAEEIRRGGLRAADRVKVATTAEMIRHALDAVPTSRS